MNPTISLTGQTIDERWLVLESMKNEMSDTTGGLFSIPYRAKDIKTGKEVFLKVIDLVKAMKETYSDLPVMEVIRRVAENHQFEVFLSDICRNRRMSRIVHAIGSGEHQISVDGFGALRFPYIVFELADGDIHTLLTIEKSSAETAWKSTILHQVATAIQQLHKANIAHQDIKRSNVVFFGDNDARLTDLGRAVKKDRPSRNDLRNIPCQFQNSPPELLYQFQMKDWGQRHFATDLYMLGNLMCTMFAEVTVTSYMISRIPPSLRPQVYSGDYKDILPALQRALSQLILEIKPLIPKPIREVYIPTLALLCNPDPRERGHPKDHAILHGSSYSAERFISYFAAMKRKAKLVIQ